jgi:hypothetical protein
MHFRQFIDYPSILRTLLLFTLQYIVEVQISIPNYYYYYYYYYYCCYVIRNSRQIYSTHV